MVARHVAREIARDSLTIYAVMLALTVAVPLSGIGLPFIGDAARDLFPTPPAPHEPATLGVLLGTALSNLWIAGWILLLPFAGLHAHPISNAIATAAICLMLAINALGVGAAIAAYPATLDYLPHLPLEWAAFAIAAAAYVTLRPAARGRALLIRQMRLAQLLAVLLIAAAAIETTVPPHL